MLSWQLLTKLACPPFSEFSWIIYKGSVVSWAGWKRGGKRGEIWECEVWISKSTGGGLHSHTHPSLHLHLFLFLPWVKTLKPSADGPKPIFLIVEQPKKCKSVHSFFLSKLFQQLRSTHMYFFPGFGMYIRYCMLISKFQDYYL